MEEPSCKYCGCKNIKCLVQCSKTGYFFCNGKGDTSQSHIIHHLQTMNLSAIKLPKGNDYHEIPIKCYICESTDIFKLGFMYCSTNIFIVCNSNCKNELLKEEPDINQDYFQSLITDGYLYPDIVSIPNHDEYKTIPISHVISVCQEICDQLSLNKEKTDSKINSIKLQYQSRQEYVSNQLEFVNAELNEAKKIELLKFTDINLEWKDKLHCRFKSPVKLFQNVKNGTFLIFQQQYSANEPQKDEEIKRVKGYISCKHKNFFIDIIFETTDLYIISNSQNTERLVTVSIQFDPTPFEKQKQTLQTYLQSENCMNSLISKIILGNTDEIIRHNRLKESIPFCPLQSIYFPPFSSSQIVHIKTALSQRFTMILGPPGTGKTTMIAALTNSFSRSGIRPVLVVSQSDESTNQALLTVARTGLKVVRFSSSLSDTFESEVDKYLTAQIALKHLKKSPETVELLSEGERKEVEQCELKIIRDCDVLCATCDDIASDKLIRAQFYTVIVDECCQSTDASLLSALVKNCQQLILLGDPCGEIGAVIRSNSAKVARFDLILMERLMMLGLRPLTLTAQFRTQGALADYVSNTFYGGYMKSEGQIDWPQTGIKWPNPNFPMFFWNVKSTEEKVENEDSIRNDQELKHVSILLNYLLEECGIKAKEIGIISPYLGQKELLIERLPQLLTKFEKKIFDDIEVGTINDFQGKESEFVIVSLVRANDSFDIGLLENKKTFCVALTRARRGLVIIGCADTFSRNKMWCQYIDYCKRRNAFVEGDLDSLKTSELKIDCDLEMNSPS